MALKIPFPVSRDQSHDLIFFSTSGTPLHAMANLTNMTLAEPTYPGNSPSQSITRDVAYGTVATVLALGQFIIAYLHLRRARPRTEDQGLD